MDNSTFPTAEVLLGLNRSATIARLLAGAVHDVNNALQVIAGSIELLDGRTDLSEPVIRALTRMRSQTGRAATSLERVTNFTKGPLDQRLIVNLRDIAERCVALREYAVKRARLTIVLEHDPAVPTAVVGVPVYLKQAILNLIANAEQALADVSGTITVSVSADDLWVQVRVADDGPGVSAAVAAHLFQPFAVVGTEAHAAGLGLWAARSIAEAHGGTLSYEPADAGAVFILRLPKADPQPA